MKDLVTAMRKLLKRFGNLRSYALNALGFMVQGLFASLIIGLMLKTVGQEIHAPFLTTVGTFAMQAMGPAVGVAVAWGLKAPALVIFACACCGTAGSAAGGPVGALLAALCGAECGKRVWRVTTLDIIVTPAVTIVTGMGAGMLAGPVIASFMHAAGQLVQTATSMQPAVAGAIIAVIMGIAMCTPLSSTALAIMLDLHGTTAGAATVGCCCQLVGFAVTGYRDNGPSGLLSLGLGCAMLQLPNIIKNPYIWLPPILASALLGPWVTTIFPMENTPEGAGMGSSGLVGQLGTLASMGSSVHVWCQIGIFHFLLPGLLTGIIALMLRRVGKIKNGDMLLSTKG